jgi:hypothetical protein
LQHSKAIAKNRTYHGPFADNTANDVGNANKMAKDTFEKLSLAKGKISGDATSKLDWKTIESLVDRFNSAKKSKDKDEALREILKLARESK